MANRAFKPPHTVVLCDLDDTLTDCGDIPHKTILATLHSLGITHTTLDELKQSNGLTRIHTRYGLDEETFWDRFNELDNRPEHLLSGLITLYPDAQQFLNRLDALAIPVHVVTNTPPEKARQTVQYLDLEPRLSGVEAYAYPCKNPRPKPHTDLAYQALTSLHFPLRKNGKQHSGKGENGKGTDGHGKMPKPHIWIVGDEEGDVNLAANLKRELSEREIDAVVHGIHIDRRGSPLPADYSTKGPHHLIYAADIIEYHPDCPRTSSA